MLNNIKAMIQEKTNLLEAADIIFEDGSGRNLDDIIVLGEEAEPEMDDFEENDEEENEEDTDNKDENDTEDNEDSSENKTDDDEPKVDEQPPATSDDSDILNSNINDEQPMGLPGDDLPTPIGAQTGEPINPDNDLLSMEIDMGSNTPKDILPVPPAGAGEALLDQSISQRVDTGFGKSEELSDEPPESNEDPSISETDDMMTEAITLADEPTEGEDQKDAPVDEEPADEESGEESEVTSAVKDKVAEAELDEEPSSNSSTVSKEDLLKKLGSITKSLEDAKKAVMSAIQ